ncbi:hypothetical protein OsI_36878 [Oryza sativa Indica Group]|uniref:Uncharacterized protein n=1 Tax=Oryza sativa subsp. indica TaxID=39946 RepID=A2ZGG9_ORYSI|nr:hypothetical protein OsI_36878 [Oryza sativa Indica Group]
MRDGDCGAGVAVVAEVEEESLVEEGGRYERYDLESAQANWEQRLIAEPHAISSTGPIKELCCTKDNVATNPRSQTKFRKWRKSVAIWALYIDDYEPD